MSDQQSIRQGDRPIWDKGDSHPSGPRSVRKVASDEQETSTRVFRIPGLCDIRSSNGRGGTGDFNCFPYTPSGSRKSTQRFLAGVASLEEKGRPFSGN